jgi:hypothetical protein
VPPTTEAEILSFSTWDQWSAADAAAFVDAVDSCYCSLVVLRDAIDAAGRERERFIRLQEETWRMYRHMPPPHPEWEMWIEEVLRVWRKLGSRGFPPPLPWMFPMFPPAAPGPTWREPETALSHMLDNPYELIRPGEELRIHSIQMSSPGNFNFLAGLGEPIAQLRELIKDVWYRNRQERARGELQILREKLELYSQYSLTVQQIDIVGARMIGDLQEIGDLIDSGKLSLEGEERRTLSDASSTKKPAPRRRRKRS